MVPPPAQPAEEGTAGPILSYSPVEIPDDIIGVTVVRMRPDVCSIYVPALKDWRLLGPALLLTTAGCTLVAATFLGMVLFGNATFAEAAGMIVDPGIIAVLGWLYCLDRLHRRTGFEVSPYALRVTTSGPFGVGRSHWSRSRIADVHINPNNKRLVVKLIKEPPAEIFVSTDRKKTGRVLSELVSALASIPAAPKDRQFLAADPSAGMPPSRARTILQRIGVGLTITAFAGVPFTACISLALLAPAGILFGIALGTQTNKSYV